MKTTIVSILLVIVIASAKGQATSPGSTINSNFFTKSSAYRFEDSLPKKKWSYNSYSSLSTGIIGWRGGHASFLSVPVGLQLNRTITNNVSAFAGVSIAPTYINRQSFMNADFSKANSNNAFFRSNNIGIYPRAELGLTYTNNERTFQISGSMSVQQYNNFYIGDPINPFYKVQSNRN
jgi:hypothetical protein